VQRSARSERALRRATLPGMLAAGVLAAAADAAQLGREIAPAALAYLLDRDPAQT
jgi:hypothetical protein